MPTRLLLLYSTKAPSKLSMETDLFPLSQNKWHNKKVHTNFFKNRTVSHSESLQLDSCEYRNSTSKAEVELPPRRTLMLR